VFRNYTARGKNQIITILDYSIGFSNKISEERGKK